MRDCVPFPVNGGEEDGVGVIDVQNAGGESCEILHVYAIGRDFSVVHDSGGGVNKKLGNSQSFDGLRHCLPECTSRRGEKKEEVAEREEF